MLRRLQHLRNFRIRNSLRSFASTSHGPVPYNEPGGVLFDSFKVNLLKNISTRISINMNVNKPVDWTLRVYIVAYIGGLAAFVFLWQFKPDTRAEKWAKDVSIQRMKERGIDLSSLNL